MSNTVALGTLTPTSITVVATSILACPDTKRCICASLASGFMRPWTKQTSYCGKMPQMRSYPVSTLLSSSLGFSAMRG